jgi:hypothetical protein
MKTFFFKKLFLLFFSKLHKYTCLSIHIKTI